MQQKYIKLDSILLSAFLVLSISVFPTYALTRSQYDKYVNEGKLSGLTIEFSDAGQKYRKHGLFIIDDAYEGGDSENPYNNDGERNAGIKLVPGASGYKVYGEIDEDTIDYSYEEDEDLNSTEYARAEFESRLKAMEYGNSYVPSIGYGKYHLRPGKNLTAFIKFAYDFYKNESGEVRVGYKTPQELSDAGINVKDPCPMEFLETYANINYTDTTNCDTGLSQIWQNCTESWTYEGDKLENTDNIFEKLQDIFMADVYLIPAIRKIKSIGKLKSTEELSIEDNAAILSMMYERFGGRPINPSKVESGAITKIGAGDIIAALVDIEGMTIAEKIYTYMIEVKYKNNEEKLAGWLKECEEVCGGYSMLDADQYNEYIKAYNEAYKKYGKDTSYDTLLDYGGVLTPDIFESKISYEKAIKKFKANLLKYFGGSSFMKQGGNPNYVAKSYAMARAMCENSNFSDITDIYACDMDVVEHTYGYDSNHIILLADTQVVTLEDVYGSDTDSDKDGMLDYVEAYNEEEVDITKFLEKYCDYNGYTDEEKEIMLTKNSKIKMYNYISNPVLPDSDFDGINDKDDMSKLNNEIHSINQTDNYEGIKITYAQDYRYFFMESDKYYEELGMMGLVLSNMASKKNNSDKTWIKENKNDREQAHGLIEYMVAIGNESIKDCTINKVPYAIGQKDVLALKGKHNNLERNVITIAIGESKEYKNILAANYDGQLGDDTGRDYHHIGYDHESDEICDALIEYDNEQNNTSWKKSYFIVGYGTGGAIANLVAKKFIDHKRSNKNIYCYTYQAPGTINRNNIPSGKKIHNTKYYSIFNHINTDDPLIYLESEDFDRYGRDKKVAAGYSNNLSDRATFGSSFLYGNQNNPVIRLLMDYNISNETNGLVTGFSFTQDVSNAINNFYTWICSLLYKVKNESEVIEMANNDGMLQESLTAKNINNKYCNAIETSKDLKYQDKAVRKDVGILPKLEVTAKGNVKVGATLKYLDELAVWYVNYVATYGSQLKGKRDYYNEATNVARKHFDGMVTKNEATDPPTYRINDINNDIDLKMINDKQTAGSGKEGRLGYKYDTLEKYADSYKTDGEKLYGKFTGDDCSGFTLGVIRLTTKGDLGKSGIAGNAGLDLVDTGTSTMITNNSNFENSMLNLGFHKYYYKDNEKVWKHKYIDSGAVVDKETTEVKGIGFLQPGDMLVCNGHVEFYAGYAYNVVYNEKYDEFGNIITNQSYNDKKKNGISSITRGERLKPGINNNGKDTNDNGRAYGTFSWGRVEDEYPVEAVRDGGEKNTNYYFTFNSTTKMFELHYSSNSPGQKDYRVIWRK